MGTCGDSYACVIHAYGREYVISRSAYLFDWARFAHNVPSGRPGREAQMRKPERIRMTIL
jgi:hypothetical protein